MGVHRRMNDDAHKLSIDVTDEQFIRMQRLFPYGMRKLVFSVIIDDLCDLIESKGEMVLSAVIARHLSLKDFGTIKEALDAKDRAP